MPPLRLLTALKALNHLGLQPVALNALYRLGLASGYYRRTENRKWGVENGALRPLFTLPTPEELLTLLGDNGRAATLAEANEIAAGKIRLFGGEAVDLKLTFDQPLQHWTAYETNPALLTTFHSPFSDIKFLWEPARFGWAFTLGRAYHLTSDENYPEAFWHYFETFTAASPPFLGPHWMSGQEVALRLMAFVWAAQVFNAAAASTTERKARLAQSAADHAARIPPTLVYARSQDNNHLLSEAAGLFTAGLALPGHPEAAHWRALGWKWFNYGLQQQIDGYGEYAQHSANYHRLMLQLALWVNALLRSNDSAKPPAGISRCYHWPRKTNEALGRATHWLLALLDSETGRTPNLGANDGAYIFPLTICPFSDYRPAAHAAARLFLNYNLPRGDWDEMSLWFGIPLNSMKYLQLPRYLGDHLYAQNSWGYLRAVRLNSRPSHADQLHFDLWWRGLNIAQDAGAYLYNAPAPWDNPLTSTLVHNTVTVDGREQMTRAGRFLYVDWVNAYWKSFVDSDERILQRVRAHHYGYWRQGIRHERRVIVHTDERWQVEDELKFMPYLPFLRRTRTFRLHWLLPDWEWKVENREQEIEISLDSPYGVVALIIQTNPPISNLHSLFSVVRAGKLLHGSDDVPPTRGWTSPTYGVKIPALSLAVAVESQMDITFLTEFTFPAAIR